MVPGGLQFMTWSSHTSNSARPGSKPLLRDHIKNKSAKGGGYAPRPQEIRKNALYWHFFLKEAGRFVMENCRFFF